MFPENVTLQTLVAYLNSKNEFNLTDDCLKVRLVEDLGVYGDDIDELLGSLIQDFGIKISNIDLAGFNVGKEPFDFISTIATIFTKKTQKQEITIEDILQFINTGVLISEFNTDKNISQL
jgi:Protein of unknown function (DUF1493)